MEKTRKKKKMEKQKTRRKRVKYDCEQQKIFILYSFR